MESGVLPLLVRDPSRVEGLTKRRFDVIIVGGGIQGATLAREASARGWQTLLIEREDFGSQTTLSSLRILHGGLRYLQTLDVLRHRDSVQARRWFLSRFPDLTRPLSCLMPLYGQGLKRPSAFRVAFLLDRLLVRGRNDGVSASQRIPSGRVLSRGEVIQRFKEVERDGLCGGALWHDGFILSPERLITEMLRWAEALGAEVLNYVRADTLLTEANRVTGVGGTDQIDGSAHEFRADRIINASGPWLKEVATDLDRDLPVAFSLSLAINVLLDVELGFEGALALAPRGPDSSVFFLIPFHGRTLAGTLNLPRDAGSLSLDVTSDELASFVGQLAAAAPHLDITSGSVRKVLSGLVPAMRPGEVQTIPRETIVDHSESGGPVGLYSVTPAKLTTAPRVAERVLDRMGLTRRGAPPHPEQSRPHPRQRATLEEVVRLCRTQSDCLMDWMKEEWVVFAEDLFLRRLEWDLDPESLIEPDDALAEYVARAKAKSSGVHRP